MPDISIAASHLHIVSWFEYIGMVVIVIFHMHEGGAVICLGKAVPSIRYLIIFRIFQDLIGIFFKSFKIAL